MNRYKALEHYNLINFKKDEHSPDKIISAEDACDRLNDLERQLEGVRELTDKFIKRTESVLEALHEDGSEEGHSEFFYRMNSKEQVLNEGFLRKLKQLKEKGDE